MYLQQFPAFPRANLGYEFDHLRRQAKWQRLWAFLLRRWHRLRCANLSHEHFKLNSQRLTGIQNVPLTEIRGSVGRCQDFDAEFRPLKSHLRERWIDIALALHREVVLPAVELVKVNGNYFVLDGHHRISVAKHQGKVAIDANVVEWQGGA